MKIKTKYLVIIIGIFMRPIEFKLEKKLARELGSVAILILLMKEPEGIHAYDLVKRVENIVYSLQQRITSQLNNILDLNNQIIAVFSDLSTVKDGKDKITNLQEKIKQNFLFKYNSGIKKLFTSNDPKQISENLSSVENNNHKLKQMMKKISQHTEVWKDVSGIYPVLNHLLQNDLIKIEKEHIIEGRVRKIYTITQKGKEFAINSQWTVLEITDFIIPFRYSMKSSKLPNERIYPLKSLIDELELDNMDEKTLMSEIEKSPLLSMMRGVFFPIIIESIVKSNNPSKLTEILERAQTKNEKIIFKCILRAILEKINYTTIEALKLLN